MSDPIEQRVCWMCIICMQAVLLLLPPCRYNYATLRLSRWAEKGERWNAPAKLQTRHLAADACDIYTYFCIAALYCAWVRWVFFIGIVKAAQEKYWLTVWTQLEIQNLHTENAKKVRWYLNEFLQRILVILNTLTDLFKPGTHGYLENVHIY